MKDCDGSERNSKFIPMPNSKENENAFSLDQAQTQPAKCFDGSGQRLQEVVEKDISRNSAKDDLSPRKLFCNFNAQDISIALATFPEFFAQGLGVEKDSFIQLKKHKLFTEDLSVRKQNLQSECGGLVLWYIREYGL